MKKFILLLMSLVFVLCFMGCGANTASTKTAQASIDVAYIAALQNNCSHKAEITKYLQDVKEYIDCTECGIVDLKDQIIKACPENYKIYAVVLSDYVDDTAVTNYLDNKINADSKKMISDKVDRLIHLSGLICTQVATK